jgi:CubicO group peptidase (beta-lactamase class C family)
MMTFRNKNDTGTAILTKENNKIIQLSTSGLANKETGEIVNDSTNFRMASVSKQFTAACIILLKNSHLLSYNDNLVKFFSSFKNGKQITLWHLLTHTSGLTDYENLIPAGQKVQVLDDDVLNWVSQAESLHFTPGSQYKYSNTAFCILTKIIEKVSRKSYPDFIQENIFKPLEMNNSYVYEEGKNMPNRALGYALTKTGEIISSDQSLTSATKGDGCVYTSLSNYQKWINAITNNTLFNLKEELSEANYPIRGLKGLHYGLGWFNYNGEELYHTGSTCGFSNAVWINGGNAIVYFSNLADNHSPAFELSLQKPPRFRFEEILALTD